MNSKALQIAAFAGLMFFLLVLLLVLLMASASDDQSENEQTRRAEPLAVGESGIVNTNDDPTNCEGVVAVGATQEAYDAFSAAAAANDTLGVTELQFEGLLFSVPNCTEVLMLGRGDGLVSFISEIRITDPENPHFGKTGFVPYEFAIQK